MVELTGFAVERKAGSEEIAFRWRALRQLERDYWTFAHVIDAQGRTVGQLDRRMQNGDRSTADWTAGDEASEARRVPIPAAAARGILRLRFGVYYPPTGERLSVQGPVDGKAHLTDHGTAMIVEL